MGLKDQFKKITDNWLIWVIIVILALFFMSGSGVMNAARFSSYDKAYSGVSSPGYSPSYESGYYGGSSSSSSGGYYYPSNNDFAPDEADRKITKTASMSNEVEEGEFYAAEANLKSIVIASNSFLLNQNVNKNNYGSREYLTGSYYIKVDVTKYDSVIAQLKQIGEVKSFNENAQDITGSYTNAGINLNIEKSRLTRYQQLFNQSYSINDKLTLSDRIFSQERTIMYLQNSINNMDQQVEYSSISFTLNEKKSDLATVTFVKFSTLLRNLIDSTSILLKTLFILLPWAVGALIVFLAILLIKKLRG